MNRIEMTDVDQRIARVCDPATANRYNVLYHNLNTGEQWLVARVLPGEVTRFNEALNAQGCKVVIYQQERGEWPLLRWLQAYAPEAPRREIAEKLRAIRVPLSFNNQ
jgi:hypothetical protein